MSIEVKVKVLPGGKIPTKATPGSAGFDLYAREGFKLVPGVVVLIPCGFCIELPLGYEAQIRPRSSLGKQGVMIPNSPGTIDSDYRGEVSVPLFVTGVERHWVHPGDRIAQMVVQKVPMVRLIESLELSETTRGAGGFGSTGV